MVSCLSKFTPGIEIATSFPDSILFTDFFSCWISFTCPIFLSSRLMNRSWAFRFPASTFTPKTAGDEFRKQKSKTLSFAIVGSSDSFFLSISWLFAAWYFSRSSNSLYTTSCVMIFMFCISSRFSRSSGVWILKPIMILFSSSWIALQE